MQISEEQVEKYKALYVEEYGKEIDEAHARAELTSLVCLMEAIYKHNNKIIYE
ncbi:MAG: hypothetical protein WCG45_01320 [bacterium]